MFNRVAQREFATAHNITGNMSKSRKRFPAGTCCCCKSQKRGKQISHRKFRRREHVLMHNQRFEKLPRRQYEITCQWDLGGDGLSSTIGSRPYANIYCPYRAWITPKGCYNLAQGLAPVYQVPDKNSPVRAKYPSVGPWPYVNGIPFTPAPEGGK